MLPGFNHNVRFNDRVYHVQTEDNGLKVASVVTQVFLAGQVLAIEKSSYQDVLDGWAEEDRAAQIRHRMQEQHKTLLKRVTEGTYEAQLESDEKTEGPTDSTIALPRPELQTTEPLPTFAETANLTAEERTMIIDESDFLSSLDAEVRRHIEASDPSLPPFDSSILPAEPPPILPRTRESNASNTPAPIRTRRLRPRPKTPSDTLVDEMSPLARSRATISEGRSLAADQRQPRPQRFRRPASSNAVPPLEQDELRRASAEMGLPIPEETGHGDPNATLLELDAIALKAKLAEQRAKLKRASERAAARWATKTAGPRSESAADRLTVNERSLDEVLLSYLDDE